MEPVGVRCNACELKDMSSHVVGTEAHLGQDWPHHYDETHDKRRGYTFEVAFVERAVHIWREFTYHYADDHGEDDEKRQEAIQPVEAKKNTFSGCVRDVLFLTHVFVRRDTTMTAKIRETFLTCATAGANFCAAEATRVWSFAFQG